MIPEVKPESKKRLLFIHRPTAFGGSEIVILNLLKAIDYKTTTVFLASPVDVFSKILGDLQLPVTIVPLTAPFNGKFAGTFISWLRYLGPCDQTRSSWPRVGSGTFHFPPRLRHSSLLEETSR